MFLALYILTPYRLLMVTAYALALYGWHKPRLWRIPVNVELSAIDKQILQEFVKKTADCSQNLAKQKRLLILGL